MCMRQVATRTDNLPMSILADGAHFRKCSGYLHIQDSVFERNGDDGFASHSEYSSVVSRQNASCVVVSGEGVDLAVIGEEWIFRHHVDLAPLGVRTLISFESANASFVRGHARQTSPSPHHTMCFNYSLPLSLDIGDVLSATVSPDLLIERTRYWGNLGHGVRIKTQNAVVRNCELGCVGSTGIAHKSCMNVCGLSTCSCVVANFP